jgi:circadian clock protein KaiC
LKRPQKPKKQAAAARGARKVQGLQKVPSGIRGLDEITDGGLPVGRTTLVTGGAGCGKTLFGLEFLCCGALKFGEPGVFVSFEETSEELAENVASMGRDLQALVAEGKIVLDHVQIDRSEIEETGEYDLDGLFIRLEQAIDSIGAKRIVLDTLETLFSGLSNTLVIRAELRRLFRWLKDKGVTAILTGERGDADVSKYALEDFVADCVIVLDHRVTNQVTTRRLRIVKYRGSTHGTNEYPFLIDRTGISVFPITSLGLTHQAPTDHVSSGVDGLDEMLDGKGYFRGSSILISGTAGTGKSTFGARFAAAACRRKETCILFAFEESPDQIIRNMRSTGTDLEPFVDKGLLTIHAARPTVFGLEHHLVAMNDLITKLEPSVVVVDPMSNLVTVGSAFEVKVMLTRLIDSLKLKKTATVFTSLIPARHEDRDVFGDFGVSSLMDTWIVLDSAPTGASRERTVEIVKSRGMRHSHDTRRFKMTDRGIEFLGKVDGRDRQ